ncbi:hypothetical protein Tco_0029330 [Tanacetum coccineum]
MANESLSTELERYKERVKLLEERQNVDLSTKEKLIIDDIIRDKNAQFANFEKEINSLKQTLSAQLKETETLKTTFNGLKNESKEKEAKNIDKEIALEKKVNIKPINYAALNRLSKDFGKCFVPQQEMSDEQAFWLQTSHPNTDQSTLSPVKIEAPRELPKTLKDIFNVFDKDLLNEVTEVQTVFNQMEADVQQYFVDKKCFEIQKKHFLIENDRLLDQIISQDIVNIVVNSFVYMNTSVNVNSSVAMNDYVNYVEKCNKCLELEAELNKQHNMVDKNEYNKLSKSFF